MVKRMFIVTSGGGGGGGRRWACLVGGIKTALRVGSAASAALGRGWLVDVDWRMSHALSARHGLHTVLYLGRHGHERLLDVGSILGAGLEKRNAQVVSKFLVVNTNK